MNTHSWIASLFIFLKTLNILYSFYLLSIIIIITSIIAASDSVLDGNPI